MDQAELDAIEQEAREEKQRERQEAQKLVGQVIGGKYRIESYVGGGAMGKVYKATQMLLDKIVAVKVLHAGLGADEKFQSRFHREAKAASRLDHVNSVGVIDFGIERDGMMFIVMEFLDGRDLFAALRKEWPFSLNRIVDVMSQTLSALAVAHDQGIVHRDLKPENIMLVSKKSDDDKFVDVVKVADFGIAKILESSRNADGEKLTTQGMIAGTPEYMSPEQAQARNVDGRSDLYSCGVILYEMATGKLPFSSETAIGVVLQHVTATPPPPHTVNPSIDPRLESIILRTLQKDPDQRFANAREMRAALRALVGLNEGAVQATETSESTGSPSFVNASTAVGLPAVPSVVMRTSNTPNGSKTTMSAPDGNAKESAGVERVETNMGLSAPTTERIGTSGVTHELPVAAPTAKKGIAPATVAASLVAALAIGALAMGRLRDQTPAGTGTNASQSSQSSATTGQSEQQRSPAIVPLNSQVNPTVAVQPAGATATAQAVDAGASAPTVAAAAAVNNPTQGSRNARTISATTGAGGNHAASATTAVVANTAGASATVQPTITTPVAAVAVVQPVVAQTTVNPTTQGAQTAATQPAAAATVAPLQRVSGSVVDVRATNGVLANRLQGRAQSAIDALARCVFNHGRTGHNDFTAPMDVSLNIAVVERRVDRVRILGAPGWVQGCSHETEPAFGGDLPEADDPEYTITIRASLAPQR
jgi:serine/threonine-protein kinase